MVEGGITDGGHFENTAAYELLRRHLEFIVVIDNGCGQQYGFGDIANLMRRVRVDFGIEMEENCACSSASCGVRLKEKLTPAPSTNSKNVLNASPYGSSRDFQPSVRASCLSSSHA